MRLKTFFITYLFSAILCVMQTMAAAIPSEYIGKWVTLKTKNGYYFYAIEENGVRKLGNTTTAPTAENYAAYCWLIEGNEADGYVFRNLKYENFDGNTPDEQKCYITNPTVLQTAWHEVLMSNTPSRYRYTDNQQLQLVDDPSLYLAFYSREFSTVRLHDSADYGGSKMIISLISDWKVTAKTNGDAILVNGGLRYAGKDYVNGSTFKSYDSNFQYAIPVAGYTKESIDIDTQLKSVVVTYKNSQSSVTTTKTAPAPVPGSNVITGETGTAWVLDPAYYITNQYHDGEPPYTTIPEGKPWEIDMVVDRPASDIAFNEWGSTILSSMADPFNSQYFNNFQIYQLKAGKINFKSSVASGADHYIAQGQSVKNKYRIIVRCNGANVYVIRTILLDDDYNETSVSYDNIYTSARNQSEITQLSCALPTGINIKDLKITIAEETGLLEGQNYAIQNNANSMYLSWDFEKSNDPDKYRKMAGYWAAADASKCQIEFTGQITQYNNALHRSFYIKTEVWTGSDVVWKYIGDDNMVAVDDADKKAFIYVDGQIIPIGNAGYSTIGTPWSLYGSDQWRFDMFANFHISISGNAAGGINYKTQSYGNDSFCEFPAGAQSIQFSNTSIVGYTASVTMKTTDLQVTYKALTTGFYNFEDHRYSTPDEERNLVYYWNKEKGMLVSYAVGTEAKWNSSQVQDNNLARGDAHQFTITSVTKLPVNLKQNVNGINPDNKYYATIYSPVPLQLPAGVKAYKVSGISDSQGDTYMTLEEIADGDGSNNVLHSQTAAVLIKDDAPADDTVFTITTEPSATVSGNMLRGVAEPLQRRYSYTTYVLGGMYGIGFYHYTGEKIPAFKAFMEFAPQSAPPRFSFLFGDDTTAIELPESIVAPSAVTYDLMGRQVARPVPGHVYITNGKKILY